jgi:hypothetical protein
MAASRRGVWRSPSAPRWRFCCLYTRCMAIQCAHRSVGPRPRRARGDAATDRDAQKRRAATIARATIAVTCRARVARVARRARDGGGAF